MAFGVLTTNSAEEAIERVGPGPSNKGWEAAMAAMEMATLFGALERPGGAPRERTRRRAARRPAGGAAAARPHCRCSINGRWGVSRCPKCAACTGTWAKPTRRTSPDRSRSFATALADGTVEHIAEIDPLIEESAENWRLARMPVLDRLILRLAVYEFLHQAETPPPVVIDEALELAKRFSTPEAVKFINGVLDGVREAPAPRRSHTRMTQEDEQIQQRRANLEALDAPRRATLPGRFDRTHTVTTLVRDLRRTSRPPTSKPPASRPRPPAGFWRSAASARRIFSSSRTGGSGFRCTCARTRCRSATSKSRGCSISATTSASSGHLFRTRTNELTIWASHLEFLGKCHIPLPEKWHGLQDVEIRYRQRYLDLIVNEESRRVFEVRSRVLAAIRRFLDDRGYLEVETPVMQPIAGGAMARPSSRTTTRSTWICSCGSRRNCT